MKVALKRGTQASFVSHAIRPRVTSVGLIMLFSLHGSTRCGIIFFMALLTCLSLSSNPPALLVKRSIVPDNSCVSGSSGGGHGFIVQPATVRDIVHTRSSSLHIILEALFSDDPSRDDATSAELLSSASEQPATSPPAVTHVLSLRNSASQKPSGASDWVASTVVGRSPSEGGESQPIAPSALSCAAVAGLGGGGGLPDALYRNFRLRSRGRASMMLLYRRQKKNAE